MKKYIGKKFGKLTPIKELPRHVYPSGRKRRRFLCKCECGNNKDVMSIHLTTGGIVSCGCYRKETSYQHGLNGTRFQRIYNGVLQRCNNKNSTHYNRYGGRGIECEWNSLVEFKNDMYDSYKKHFEENDGDTTIERISNNGNYCKENCTRATMKEQAENRAHKTSIEYKDKSKSKTEWANFFGLDYHTFKQRLKRAGGFEEMLLHYNMEL